MTRLIAHPRIVFVSFVFCAAVGPTTFARGELETKTFERAWSLIDRNFYDPDHHGLDWDAIGDKYRPEADGADSPEEVREVIQRMLSELGASHCSVLDGEVYKGMIAELANKRTPTFGLLLEQDAADRYFARAIFEGGPAADAGIQLGDRILAIDGVPIEESPRIVDAGYDPGLTGANLWFLRVGDEREAMLVVEASEQRGARRVATLEARDMNGVDAMANSARVIDRAGLRLGVIHIWYCSRGVGKTLREKVTGDLAECDGLVVDLRGRGGYSDVVGEVLQVFRGKSVRDRSAALWKKPVVFLIDSRSRSAKEILAYRIRHENVGTLVGEKTEGAVLGAMFHPLPDGSYLELPGVAVPVNGVSLEGVGVEPDVRATVELPYAQGLDGILEAGLDVAVEKVRAWRRGPY
jgi:carboxyl-terminal processing protease